MGARRVGAARGPGARGGVTTVPSEGMPQGAEVHLAAIARRVAVAAGAEVPVPANGAAIAIVHTGRLAVVVDNGVAQHRTIALLQEGDALVLPTQEWPGPPGPRCRAQVDSSVFIIASPMGDLLRDHPAAGAWLVRALAAGVADREISAAIALEPRVERRLLLKLRQLAEKWGRVTPEGVRLDLRVTHQELADMVGAARESITVALASLRDQGKIDVRQRTVIIRRMTDQDATATDTA